MNQQTQTDFEVLPMPKKDSPALFGGHYRVYKAPNDYVMVSAGSALEALQMSGLSNAYKIERESMDNISVLSHEAWANSLAADEPQKVIASLSEEKETILLAAAETDNVQVSVADVAQNTTPTADSALSNEDVEKLLKQ